MGSLGQGPKSEKFFVDKPEFDFIAALVGPNGLRRDGMGPGDDACLTQLGEATYQAISVDASVEGIHYRLDWVSPAEALLKAVLSNLSDINAMGGRTEDLYLTLGAAPGWGLAEANALGLVLREMAERYGFRIAGGDTVRLHQESFFAITVVGKVEGRPLLRSAVRPGDRIYVSGALGLSSLGLQALLQGSLEVSEKGQSPKVSRPQVQPASADSDHDWRDEMRQAESQGGQVSLRTRAIMNHLLPQPPLTLGPALASLSREIAAIDISDGLSSELWHLSRQSACRIEVDWSKLPYDPALCEALSLQELKGHVLHSGEEYQLVFAGHFTDEELSMLRTLSPIHEIGIAVSGDGVWLRDGESIQPLVAGGYTH